MSCTGEVNFILVSPLNHLICSKATFAHYFYPLCSRFSVLFFSLPSLSPSPVAWTFDGLTAWTKKRKKPTLTVDIEQFNKAGLCIFNNNWHQVYDFNAFDGDDNHWILSSNLDLSTFYSEALKFLPEISCDPRKSIIPLTLGHRTPESDCNSCCLVVLFCDGSEEKRACDLIDLLTGQHSVCFSSLSSSHSLGPLGLLHLPLLFAFFFSHSTRSHFLVFYSLPTSHLRH